MNNTIIFDGEIINFIWNTIQQEQIIFHPNIAPNGKIDYKVFAEISGFQAYSCGFNYCE